MYIDELVLRDFRAIAAGRVSFVHPAVDGADGLDLPNLNVIVGVNGSGKSTVLKAIALAYATARQAPLPANLLGWPRFGSEEDLRLGLRWSDPTAPGLVSSSFSLAIPRSGERGISAGAMPSGFFASYGPLRQVGNMDGELAADIDASPLLHDDVPLMGLDRWLAESRHQAEVAEILNAVLPDDVDFVGGRDAGDVFFAQRRLPVPWRALSDGIRGLLAWMCDLLWRLDQHADTRLSDVAGVVLVDEIDQRMHPAWQQSVLPNLATTLPALQFICTAHSPLIPSGLRRRNLLLVEPDSDFPDEGATTVRRLEIEEVYGRTADQILGSSYFGLVSTRSDIFRQELRTLALQAQSSADGRDAALTFMRRLADPDRSGEDDS